LIAHLRTSVYSDAVTVPSGLVEEVARRFSLLADPTRLRILDALLERGDITVTELAGVVGEAAPNVSQHLSRLLAADIVGRRRDGRTVRYSISDTTIQPLCDLMCSALSGRNKE
jgi:ArsR family transcriptional regulator, lead/cadmium/zinc/bismuth-responsive transcriptional repressor